MIDANQDWFIQIAIPVQTGHVWTSKVPFFVKGSCPFVNTTIDKVNPFVCVPDTVAASRRLSFTFQ